MSDPQATNNPSLAPRSRTLLNLAAAYTSKGLQVLLALVCMPIYLQQLGAGGFGVIGLFLSIQRIATLFDSGFSRAINREMAGAAESSRPGDAVRTLEIVYLAVVTALLGFAIATSGPLSAIWQQQDARTIVVLMSAAIAAQAPSNYYAAVLAGLERHVTLNVLQSAWQTARFVGSALVLMAKPTLVAFFGWQIAAAAAFTTATAICAWHAAPATFLSARFDLPRLKAVRRYAGGVTLCAMTAVLITQLDKLILFRQLTADDFGFYMLGWSLASSLFIAVSPIGSIFFPKLSRLASSKEKDRLRRTYHNGSQLVAIVVTPLASVIAVHAWHVVLAWTGDPSVADHCCQVAGLLATGVGINCLCLMPHTLQLAFGWTGLSNRLNVVAIAIFGPAIYFSATTAGTVGAGITWVVFSLGFLLVQVVCMHKRLLTAELWPWIRLHVAVTAACVLAVIAAGAVIPRATRLGSVTVVLSGWLAATAAACLLCPSTWHWLESLRGRARHAAVASAGDPCHG